MFLLNITGEYDKLTLTNCTNNENNIDIIMPSLLLTISLGLSFLSLMSLRVYTLFTHLFNIK